MAKDDGAPVGAIKKALVSHKSCNEATVAFLRVLLGAEEPKRGKGAKPLDADKAFRLATEVVNVSLKSLTEAIKSKPEERKPLQARADNKQKDARAGVKELAECARLAFSTLRKHDTQNLPKWQIETGMSALIGKLAALDLDDLAIKELRIMTRRLGGPKGEPKSLADLLPLPTPTDPKAAALVVASQLQILKLCARRSAPTIDGALKHFLSESPNPQIIKALNALCPNSSTQDDSTKVSPELVLKTQALIFTLGPGKERETAAFLAHVRAFVRRSSNLSAIEDVIASLQGKANDRILSELYRTQADVSRANPKKALKYAKMALNGGSNAWVCSCRCFHASLELQANSKADLQTVRECITGDLSGTRSELEDLLVTSSSLRKQCFASLPKEPQCRDFILLMPRFLLRRAEVADRSELEKSRLLSVSILQTIETITNLVKTKSELGIEPVLNDCIRLAEILDSDKAFALVSNAFWYGYISDKNIAHLQKSVDLSRGHGLHLKLEKLGNIKEAAGADAADYYRQAIEALGGDNLTEENFRVLVRLFTSLHRCGGTMKVTGETLLEAEAQALAATNPAAVERNLDSLLEIYTDPLQRLKAIVRALQIRYHKREDEAAQQTQFYEHLSSRKKAYDCLFGNVSLKQILTSWLTVVDQTWDGVQEQVECPSDWANQLTTTAEYLQLQGKDEERCLCLQVLANLQNLDPSSRPVNCVATWTELGILQTRMGNSEEGGKALQKAQKLLENIPVSVASLRWYMGRTEYFQAIGSQKSHETYAKVEQLFSELTASLNSYEQASVASDVMHLFSVFAAASGESASALFYARKSVRSAYRCWALLEQADAPVLSNRLESLSTAKFWPLVPVLFRRLMHLSTIISHEGILPEAQHYATQAENIANSVQSHSYIAEALLLQARFDTDSGKYDSAITKLQQVEEMAEPTTEFELRLALSHFHLSRSELPQAIEAARKAKELAEPQDQIKELTAAMEKTNIKSRARKPVKPKAKAKPVPNHAILRQQARSQCQLALSHTRSGSLEPAEQLLKSVDATFCAQNPLHFAAWSAELLISQGLQSLSLDPIYNLLEESTISSPAIALESELRLGKTPYEAFSKAVDALKIVSSNSATLLSSVELHKLCDLFCKSLMMFLATSPAQKRGIGPILSAYSMELCRSVSVLREQNAISVEKLIASDADPVSMTAHMDVQNFQKDYIDIIPTDWTVVSLSISDNRDELRMSRLRSGQSPFVVTVPLNRQGPNDEEPFEFDEGKKELQEIVGLVNFSTHEARDMSQKGAKTEWWEARAGLDAKLKDLLVNIQNIWMGGFRSIFSHPPKPELLSRFQSSFYKTLNKHLPSRQKTKGKVVLDPQILELFVGLRDADDEALMDLLYFVIDILQFNGERNAYDEIDFDAMVIEVRDALLHYHAAKEEVQHHIILILDKALHCFPWESMPCLDGLSVSRLPSLSSLRSRILAQQPVDPSDGAYILNPGGDLKHTQTTFKQPLGGLTSWAAMIDRKPTEAEIASYLGDKSVYLYFGHGSGGQYIRARTVRRLDKCAVALLMGCSSGTLTEAGRFESYGTPLDYLHGGAPAVVGTLWDVTDKDIDRFSMAVLEKWGLLSKPTDGKRKKKKEKLSLDKAVAESRSSCLLRYINGAAPVIYGVPVYLK